jgi:cysteine desulfurase
MIYLDHAATTPVSPEVLEAMLPWFGDGSVGNPSSLHAQGVAAHQAIERAREQVAAMINADASEIYFTSGGTESNNAWLRCIDRGTIITTKAEHHSVSEPLAHYDRGALGVPSIALDVGNDCRVDPKWLDFEIRNNSASIKDRIGAVSIMWANNELGSINPMEEIGTVCKKYDIPLHTDAVAAVGHTPIDVKKCHIDMLSASGHKFGAPQGTGFLYISSKIHKKPLIFGGGQERGLRGGTQNVPGIVGLGKAAEIITKSLIDRMTQYMALRNVFLSSLAHKLGAGRFRVNCDNAPHIDNIVSLTIFGVHSEALLMALDMDGVCISAGAACSSGNGVSHVLRAIGMPDEEAACTVRISFGETNDGTDVVDAAYKIAEISQRLSKMS